MKTTKQSTFKKQQIKQEMPNKKPLTIIFLGLQGSGKGTQAHHLRESYRFEVLDTGDILRNMIKNKKGPFKVIKTIEKGNLVPPVAANKIMEKEIFKISKNKNLVIDGFPRTPAQIYALNKILEKTGRFNNYYAVDLVISQKTAIERLLHRWTCIDCGMVFKSDIKKCKECGGKIIKRKDDTLVYIKKRIKNVSKFLDKLKNYYERKGRLIEINGEGNVENIHKEIVSRVGLW